MGNDAGKVQRLNSAETSAVLKGSRMLLILCNQYFCFAQLQERCLPPPGRQPAHLRTSSLAVGQGAFRSQVEMANYRYSEIQARPPSALPKVVLQMLSVWRSLSYKVRNIKKIGNNSPLRTSRRSQSTDR